MNRDIHRLLDGRIDKIIMKLRATKDAVPSEFVRQHYRNTAAYGKFNTVDEANIILKLYKESTMSQAQAPITSLEHALTVARQAEQQANEAHRQATAALTSAAIKLGDSKAKHADAKAALGKQRLTDAIALVDKVFAEAPKGSAANRDIIKLLDKLATRELASVFGPAFYGASIESIVAGPVTGRTSSATANVSRPDVGGVTAEAIRTATTSVGAGQPRQARPSPTVSAPSMCATCPLTK